MRNTASGGDMKRVCAALLTALVLLAPAARAQDQPPTLPASLDELSKYGTGYVYKLSQLLDNPVNPGGCLWEIGPATDDQGNEISPILFISGYIRDNGNLNFRTALILMGFRHLPDGRSVRYTFTDAKITLPAASLDLATTAEQIDPGDRYEFRLPPAARDEVVDAIVKGGIGISVRGMESAKAFATAFPPPEAPATQIFADCLGRLEKDIAMRKPIEKPPTHPQPTIPANAGPDETYLAYVDQATENPGRGNWGMIRALYPDTSFYRKIGGGNIAQAGHEAFSQFDGNSAEKVAALRKFMRENFGSIGVHYRALQLRKSGQAAWVNQNVEETALDGLMKSIVRGGDSRSLGTAIKVISREEAGFLLATILGGAQSPDLSFKDDNGILYITADAVWPTGKTPYTAWFVVDNRAKAP